jgi:MerR family transcriptional regulator, light-induced transcriptional regulator
VTFADRSSASALVSAPGLTVAAVARRLGVAPATLRTWERRYGLGPSEHTAGSHRRYTAEDISRLERMRRLVLSGVAPVDAARTALTSPDVTSDAALAEVARLDPSIRATTSSAPAHAGGGRVIAMPGGSPAARGLGRAAMSLDSDACVAIVSETVEAHGVEWTWTNLLAPVLSAVGQRWERTGDGIEVEHVLSMSITTVMTAVTQRLREPVNARTVLLACADGDLHSLPLHTLAASLSERGIGTRMLGERVPPAALIAAIRLTGPAAVLVWSQTHSTGDPAQLADVPEVRPAPMMLAAGPGWHGDAAPGVIRVHDLGDAVARISTAVGL